jgi:hypothetical protein
MLELPWPHKLFINIYNPYLNPPFEFSHSQLKDYAQEDGDRYLFIWRSNSKILSFEFEQWQMEICDKRYWTFLEG